MGGCKHRSISCVVPVCSLQFWGTVHASGLNRTFSSVKIKLNLSLPCMPLNLRRSQHLVSVIVDCPTHALGHSSFSTAEMYHIYTQTWRLVQGKQTGCLPRLLLCHGCSKQRGIRACATFSIHFYGSFQEQPSTLTHTLFTPQSQV